MSDNDSVIVKDSPGTSVDESWIHLGGEPQAKEVSKPTLLILCLSTGWPSISTVLIYRPIRVGIIMMTL